MSKEDFEVGDLVVVIYNEPLSFGNRYTSTEIWIVLDKRKWDYGVYADGPEDEIYVYNINTMQYVWAPKRNFVLVDS